VKRLALNCPRLRLSTSGAVVKACSRRLGLQRGNSVGPPDKDVMAFCQTKICPKRRRTSHCEEVFRLDSVKHTAFPLNFKKEIPGLSLSMSEYIPTVSYATTMVLGNFSEFQRYYGLYTYNKSSK